MLAALDDLHQILGYMATALALVLALALGRGPERACALIVVAVAGVAVTRILARRRARSATESGL